MITTKKISAGQSEYFTGWASYSDLSLGTQTITSIPTKLLIDTDMVIQESQLPIDAQNSLWNGGLSKINPISLNDSYDVRVSFYVQSKTSSPTKITYILDIGGTSSITNNVYESTVGIFKTAPYNEGFTFPIFCNSTFLDNGGQIFLFTDTGSINIASKNILLIRTHKGF